MKYCSFLTLNFILFSIAVNASKFNNYNFVYYKSNLLILNLNLLQDKSTTSFKSKLDSFEYLYYNKFVLKSKVKNKLVSNRDDSLVYYFFNIFDYNKKDQENKNLYNYLFLKSAFNVFKIYSNLLNNDCQLSNYFNYLLSKSKSANTINTIFKFFLYAKEKKMGNVRFYSEGVENVLKELYCLLGNSEMSDQIETYYGEDCEDLHNSRVIKLFGLDFISFGNDKCLYTPLYKQKSYLNGFNKIFNEYQKYKLFYSGHYFTRLVYISMLNYYLDSCLNMFNKIYENKNKYKSQKKQTELQLAFNDINYSIVNYTQSSYILSCLPAWVKDPKKVEWHSIIKLIYLRAIASCLLGNTEAANADFKIIQDYAPNLPIFKIKSCN